MRNWTIRHRILGGFAAVLGLMLLMGGVAYVNLAEVERRAAAVQQDGLPGMYYSLQLMNTLSANYAIVENILLQEDEALLQREVAALASSGARLEEFVRTYEATVFQAQDREHFATFKEALGAYVRAQEELLDGGANRPDHQARRQQFDRSFARATAAIQRVADLNHSSATTSARQILGTVDAARIGVALSCVIAVLLAIVCGYFLLRAITRPLGRLAGALDVMRQGDFTQRIGVERHDEFGVMAEGFNRMIDELTVLVGQVQKSGIQVNSAVTEVAATAREQQATASEIAATTTEIGATSKEIAATTRELVKTMKEVASVAEHSAELADSGQVGVSHMEGTMQQVMEAAGTINAKLAVLNEKAGNITQVVATITKVADQTNLLSLNAAIEAEKAGEYGRGFAVVATEIRRLADQTAVATYDIEQMVKEIQSALSASVMGMDRFSEEVRRGMQDIQQVGGQLSQIIQQVQALAPRFEAVNEGMQAQATGAEQITEALAQLSEAAQQTVESLRQSGQAINDLNQVASALRGGVSRFKLA